MPHNKELCGDLMNYLHLRYGIRGIPIERSDGSCSILVKEERKGYRGLFIYKPAGHDQTKMFEEEFKYKVIKAITRDQIVEQINNYLQ